MAEESASAANAGSFASSRSRARIARTNASGRSRSAPASRSSTILSISRVEYSCAASQRLNGSVSWAIRNASSSSPRSISTFTGAEKPRAIDGTGRAGTFENRNVWCGSRTSITASFSPARPDSAQWSGTLRPSSPSNATRTGTCSGSFSGCPGVGGVCCSISSTYCERAASYAPRAVSTGVPACVYQRRNCPRFIPDTASIAPTKSPVVTAWPSWRSK